MDNIRTYLPKTMTYSRPELYANATLSSQVLCCKHYISMYLDEYLKKNLGFLQKIGLKIPYHLNFTFLELRYNIFHIFLYIFRCT